MLRPSWLWGCHQELAGRDPEAEGKGRLNPAHSDISLTDGKAGPGKGPGPPSVQWADGENLS